MSVKVVEGQMAFLKDVAKMSEISDSMASESIRTYVEAVEKSQAVAPDVLPRSVAAKATIESDTGRVVDSIS